MVKVSSGGVVVVVQRRPTNSRSRSSLSLVNVVFALFACLVSVGYPAGVVFFAISRSSAVTTETVEAVSSSTTKDDLPRNHVVSPVSAGQQRMENPTQTIAKDSGRNQTTVAFAVSVTGCGSDPITEGAAVLKHSIHRASVHGTLGGTYDYQMFAIYHPSAEKCTLPLKELGYTLMKRDVFVKVEDIKGAFLRNRIAQNGCCGEKELIKLEAYTLTDFPIVVHFDLDVLVLKPMDELFDWMINTPLETPKSDSIMWPNLPWSKTINAFFTMDYNMVHPTQKYKPVQGGFLVLRPSMQVYKEFQTIVAEGDFREGGGWGGKVGPFYGSMTFQGLIPYYYNYLHPGQSVELSRCIYNHMSDNPRTEKTVNDVVHGKCRVGTLDCEDCRSRPVQDVVTTHFTLCQKPWMCLSHAENAIQHRLCRKLTAEWYKVRSEMEASWGRGDGKGTSGYEVEIFYGHCKHFGKPGYIPIAKPYGAATA